MRQNNENGTPSEYSTNGARKEGLIKGLKGGRGWKDNGIQLSTSITFIDAISDQAATIGKQLRSVLKRNNAMEFGGRYRSGKLLARRFIRTRTVKDKRIFARRIIKSNQSYAFAIASDISGSMFNTGDIGLEPGSYALSTMHMVGEALRLASTPRAMIIFGDESVTVAPMGKTQIRWDQLADEKSHNAARPGGTDISRAIKACVRELSKIRAERKIMIVLTDGQSSLKSMQEEHKKATNAGIECLGIEIAGYGSSYMDQTFTEKKNTKIRDTDNTALIGQAFIDILKKAITKSI